MRGATLRYGWKKQVATYALELVGYLIVWIIDLLKKTKSGQKKRILLIEPFQMGDVAALSVLFHPLAELYPDSELYVLARKGPGQIATTFSEVTDLLISPFPWVKDELKGFRNWLDWFQKMLSYRRYGFDLGIDVRGDVRSQISLKLAGCVNVLSYRQYIYSDLKVAGFLVDFKTKSTDLPHIFDRNRFLLTGLGASKESLFPINFPTFHLKEVHPIPHEWKNSIVIHPGASWKFKLWKDEEWALLIKNILDRLDKDVIIVGITSEKNIVRSIANKVGSEERISIFFPTLEGLIRILKSCYGLIGVDSGPMCIANCLSIPRIALFGPGVSEVWKPYANGDFIQRVENYRCYPCIQKECIHPQNSCMTKISSEDVYKIIEKSWKR